MNSQSILFIFYNAKWIEFQHFPQNKRRIFIPPHFEESEETVQNYAEKLSISLPSRHDSHIFFSSLFEGVTPQEKVNFSLSHLKKFYTLSTDFDVKNIFHASTIMSVMCFLPCFFPRLVSRFSCFFSPNLYLNKVAIFFTIYSAVSFFVKWSEKLISKRLKLRVWIFEIKHESCHNRVHKNVLVVDLVTR